MPFFLFFFLLSAPSLLALLQGNEVFLLDDPSKPVNELRFELDDSSPDSYFWRAIGKHEARETVNLESKHYFSFRIQTLELTPGSSVEVFLEIHEDTHEDGKFVFGIDKTAKVLVGRFSGKPEEKEWKKIAVPFANFREIRHWDRILEAAFVVQIRKGGSRGKFLVKDFLAGSHYPDGLSQGIQMQNRVSSFKIGGRLAETENSVKSKPAALTLVLTFVDPYLEEIRIQESADGSNWNDVRIFRKHDQGGVYAADWNSRLKEREVDVRAIAVNVLGGEEPLAGPYRVHLD